MASYFSHRIWAQKNYWVKDYLIDYSPYAKDIHCPVLIITGKKDYAVGPDSYKSWKFENPEIVFYDGAHFSFLERPVWFADIVLQFLKRNMDGFFSISPIAERLYLLKMVL